MYSPLLLAVENFKLLVLFLGTAITFMLRKGLLLLSNIFPESVVWEKHIEIKNKLNIKLVNVFLNS